MEKSQPKTKAEAQNTMEEQTEKPVKIDVFLGKVLQDYLFCGHDSCIVTLKLHKTGNFELLNSYVDSFPPNLDQIPPLNPDYTG